MFDYAADGNISFNDPAYALLRKSMNGFIRYAHTLTFFRDPDDAFLVFPRESSGSQVVACLE
jgi:hypothetical protein